MLYLHTFIKGYICFDFNSFMKKKFSISPLIFCKRKKTTTTSLVIIIINKISREKNLIDIIKSNMFLKWNGIWNEKLFLGMVHKFYIVFSCYRSSWGMKVQKNIIQKKRSDEEKKYEWTKFFHLILLLRYWAAIFINEKTISKKFLVCIVKKFDLNNYGDGEIQYR